jgi:2-dehydro-3-deoxygluconokinase
MAPDIVSIGEPLMEFSAVDAVPLSQAGRFISGWGGDTSNFVVAACRLGGRAGYITRLGDDPFGEALTRLWAREGVDIAHVGRDPEAFTGVYFISREGGTHRFTYFRKGSAASRMRPEQLPADYLRQAKLLHVSGITQAISRSAAETASAAVAIAREAGVIVSYDPNYRTQLWTTEAARDAFYRTAPQADLLLPSLDDAQSLLGIDEPDAVVRHCLALGAKIVVLKLGREGALMGLSQRHGEPEHHLRRFPPCAVAAVDSSGAGDTFDAAFAVGLIAGWPPVRCARFASAAGALVTTGLGAVHPIPSRAAAEALMATAGVGEEAFQ